VTFQAFARDPAARIKFHKTSRNRVAAESLVVLAAERGSSRDREGIWQ
jgi:hypothetical protein